MQPLNKEQLQQATNILSIDMSLDGSIRAWACGTHGQQKISYVFEDGKVKVKCCLCDSSNQWSLPEKQEKVKACLVCGLTLTPKEATQNPELICDICYSIGEV